MGALRALAAAVAFIAAVLSFSAQGREAGDFPASEQWRPLAAEAAARFGLPVEWVMRVIAAESGGRTKLGGKPIVSHAGAMGLMQIMPATWAALRAQYRLGPDPHDPRDNIVAGTAYLRAMYDRFGYPGLFGAYNAGPGRYGDHVEKGRPLPRETRDYVAKIAGGRPMLRAVSGAADATDAGVIGGPQPGPDPIFLSRKPGAEHRTSAASPASIAHSANVNSVSDRAERDADSLFLLRTEGGGDGE